MQQTRIEICKLLDAISETENYGRVDVILNSFKIFWQSLIYIHGTVHMYMYRPPYVNSSIFFVTRNSIGWEHWKYLIILYNITWYGDMPPRQPKTSILLFWFYIVALLNCRPSVKLENERNKACIMKYIVPLLDFFSRCQTRCIYIFFYFWVHKNKKHYR